MLPIFDVLLEEKWIDPSALEKVKQESHQSIEASTDLHLSGLENLLVEKAYLSKEKLLKAYAKYYNFPFVSQLKYEEDEVFSRLSSDFLERVKVVPIQKTANTITMATSEPKNLHIMDDIRNLLSSYHIEFVISTEEEVMRIIQGSFDQATAAANEIMQGMSDKEYSELENLSEDMMDLANDAPIIRMVNAVLNQAVQERASDIHIEPNEKFVDVRYRIDGVLHLKFQPPRLVHAGLTSRIKIMASLNIAENRLPQDGRIKIKIANQDIDIRVSTIPTQYGERVVMRLLNKDSMVYKLDKMGIDKEMEDRIIRLINEPNGIILVTGPTGSGKSTTLYAMLTDLNNGTRNILTAEDPVEYEINGIGQMQMQSKIGLRFC